MFIPIGVLCQAPASTRNNFQSYCKPGAEEDTKKNDFKIFLLIQLFEIISDSYSMASQKTCGDAFKTRPLKYKTS